MLKREDYLMISERRAEGAFIKDIAQELGVHPKTVSRALKRGGEPPARSSGIRETKLGSFEGQIDEWLRDGIWNASVIYRRLKAAGYTGGYTMVRDYIHPRRRLRAKGTVRYETAMGEQLQHDWGEQWLSIGGEAQKVYLAVNVLGYSRADHVVAMRSLDAEHTYDALIQSFEYFGGVPKTVLVDNQKAAVLDWRGGRPCFNPRFRELGKHYGFVPKACRPRRAQTKGKVERIVRYVKENALAGRPAFDSWAELNQYLTSWCNEVANRRRHADLKEVVRDRWQQERSTLQSLPADRFDTAYHAQRQVSLDAYVCWRGCRYSVPGHLAGESVALRVTLAGQLEVRYGDQGVITSHQLATTANATVLVNDHHASLWAQVRVSERSLADYAALEVA